MDSIDYYNRYAAAYYEQTVDLDMSEVMRPFVELLPEDAEVLDLGCGSGRDTLALQEFGFYVTPMDGSAELCKLAEINLDQDVLNLTFDEMDFEDVFDGIWACASLLHVEPKKMPDILKKIFAALKEEGVLYFSVYEGDRDGMYGGRYFKDYTKQEIRELLEPFSNAEIVDIWRTDDVRREKDGHRWLNVLVKKG